MDSEAAVARMRAAQFEPLEPFESPDQPWRCRCLACGRVVTPRLSTLDAGRDCKYCATKGRDLNAPAVVFVLTHPQQEEPVVGFDASDGDVIAEREKSGWTVYKAASVPTVEDAYEITAAVLRWMASEPTGHDAPEIWATVSSELSRRRRRRRAQGSTRSRQ